MIKIVHFIFHIYKKSITCDNGLQYFIVIIFMDQYLPVTSQSFRTQQYQKLKSFDSGILVILYIKR